MRWPTALAAVSTAFTHLGLAAGASVEVECDGGDLEGIQSLASTNRAIAEPIAGKERWFKITAAADVPAGTYDVRTAVAGSASAARSSWQFSTALPKSLEIEPNNTIDQASDDHGQLPVNGMSDGENVDRFRFPLKAGQRIVLDVDAQKLDSTARRRS